MAPLKDIRSFFKPAEKPARSDPPQRDASATRVWPSPRLDDRHRSPSGPQVAPIPSSLPSTSTGTSRSFSFNNSQSSVNSNGSKKAMHKGQPIVLNSESDSDPELYEELDFGLTHLPTQKRTSEGPMALRTSTPATRSYLPKKDEDLRKPPVKSTNAAKQSLSRLVKEAQRDAETAQRLAAIKADLEKPIEITSLKDQIDESTLAGVVRDDEEGEDKAKRLYLAMQRTNALDSECVFHFFRGSSSTKDPRRMSFPGQSLPKHGWTANLAEPWKRDHAFLSGFAQQIFQYQSLPDELATWITDQICSGPSSGLSGRYVQLLESHPKSLARVLNRAGLEAVFSDLGADVQCLDQKLQPNYEHVQASKRHVTAQLRSVLRLLRSAARCIDPEARKYALLILMHLCLDDTVISDAATFMLTQDTIEAMMRFIPDRHPMLNDIAQALLSRISNPVLQNTLVTSLPVTSPMAAAFRRHLALSFLIYPTPLTVSLSDSDSSSLIHDHLDNSEDLQVTRQTNYRSLAASLSLLDIGIGPGPTTVPCQPPSIDGEALPPLLGAEEIAFNKQLDALVQHIKLLGNQIVEAGAISDLTRLEAKDCVERLCHRLENAARIGGRKKRAVFEDEDEVVRATKRIFGKWMVRGGTGVVKVDIDDVKEEEGTSSAMES